MIYKNAKQIATPDHPQKEQIHLYRLQIPVTPKQDKHPKPQTNSIMKGIVRDQVIFVPYGNVIQLAR